MNTQTESPELNRSPLSVWAMSSFWAAVLGYVLMPVFSCACNQVHRESIVFGAVAVFLGLLGLLDMRLHPYLRKTGWAFAVAGILLGGTLAIGTTVAYIRWQNKHFTPQCMNNEFRLFTAMIMYTDNWDGRLPPGAKWNERMREIAGDSVPRDYMLRCTSRKDSGNQRLPTYAMNAQIVEVRLKDIANPSETPLIFESRPGNNLVGGPKLLPNPPRHEGRVPILFCDGHVDLVAASKVHDLTWAPKMKEVAKHGK